MSDVPGGPGWWQASDLKWYPPERHPNYVASLPPPPPPLGNSGSPTQSGSRRRLDDIERNRILDRAINSRDRPVLSGNLGGWLVLHQPKITPDRSHFSAVLQWGKTVTSPIVIVLMVLLSFVTCGLSMPWWLFLTLRRNRFVQKVFIDEYGLQHWGLAPIPLAQRVLSVVVFIGMIWWIVRLIGIWHAAQMD